MSRVKQTHFDTGHTEHGYGLPACMATGSASCSYDAPTTTEAREVTCKNCRRTWLFKSAERFQRPMPTCRPFAGSPTGEETCYPDDGAEYWDMVRRASVTPPNGECPAPYPEETTP